MLSQLNKFVALPLILLCKLWQLVPSKLLGERCRFYPSCSEYSRQALVKYGFFPGVMLASRRVFRCHPFNPGGVDLLK